MFLQIINTSGQIIYTRISFPDTLRRGDALTVDLNNDGLYDVSLFHTYYDGGSGCAPLQENINFGSVNYLQIFKDVNTGSPAIFNNGDTIKGDVNYQERACENDLNKPCFTIEKIIHEGCSYNIEYEGLYSDFSNKYFGVKFLINNEYHFAWLKFSQLKGGHIWFDSYAYDSQLNDYLVIDDLNPAQINSQFADNLKIYPTPVTKNQLFHSLQKPMARSIFHFTIRRGGKFAA